MNKDGSSLSVLDFASKSGIDVVSETFSDRISISFTPDSNNSNGTLYINGVTGYDSDAGTFDSLILEIKAETDLAATSGGDFG